jgi:hypothetical protein
LLKWAEEVSYGESYVESDADSAPSDHDTESEIEAHEDFEHNIAEHDELQVEELDPSPSKNDMQGENRYKLRHLDIVKTRIKCPGLKNRGFYKEDPENVWKTLFDYDIFGVILQWTNKRMAKIRLEYTNETSSDLFDLDIIELRSFIGLLLFTSIFKSNHEDLRTIFATDGSGRDIFRCVTNANRFAIILSTLRIDDPETRVERRNQDILTPISEICNAFIRNCQNVYTIGFCACVGEMLVSFRGRSKFKMYMPQKPCKYGLKIMALKSKGCKKWIPY